MAFGDRDCLFKWNRLTRDQYQELGRQGILPEGASVELIRGIVIEQSKPMPRHSSVVARLLRLLHARFGDGAQISCRSTVGIGDHSEPNPDIAILRRRDDFYGSKHPEPPDVILLIEVADTSCEFDLGTAMYFSMAALKSSSSGRCDDCG